MCSTFKTDDALHDFPTDAKSYFLYNIQLVNIPNLYEVALNTILCYYTLPHYTKEVIMFKRWSAGFAYSVGIEALLW
jgi:hypothetical protein